MIKQFQNQYGKLVVEKYSETMPVTGWKVSDFPDDIKFDVNVAEQIALITGNNKVQLCCSIENVNSYLLFVHETSSTGFITRINGIEYTKKQPAESIIKMLHRNESISIM